MATGRRRKRSARFTEIAAEAGVSASTVDRVLNERGSVSDKARRKVIAAAQRLSLPRILPSATHELIHIDVLLPDNMTPFFLRLRASLASICSILDKQFVIHRRIVRESDQRSLVQAIIKPSYRRRGLVIAAPDTQAVRKAVEGAFDRGEAVVTVVSNVADVPGIAYFGIDNYRAGRTAGFVMWSFHPAPRSCHVLEWTQRLGCASAKNRRLPRRCEQFVPKPSLRRVVVRNSRRRISLLRCSRGGDALNRSCGHLQQRCWFGWD